MFESAKSFFQIIGICAYVICGSGFSLIIICIFASIAPLNIVISLVWWLPLLYVAIKEDDRRAIAETLKYWAGKPVSEERKKKILEDIA